MVDSIVFKPVETGPIAPAGVVDPNRPAWLPENFATPEAFAKSNAELQAEFTRTRQELAKLKGEADPVVVPPVVEAVVDDPAAKAAADAAKVAAEAAAKDTADAAAAAEAAKATGFDLNPYQTEYDTTGDVTPENRDKIAEGLKSLLGEGARAIVDDFIEGRKLTVENDNKLFMDAAGGSAEYETMIKWAATSLPKEDIAVYNKATESGDRHAVLFAIEGLKGKYRAANGQPANLLVGGGGTTVTEAGFASVAEMTTAMKNPLYKTDPAYRAKVTAKLAVSKNI